MLFEYLNLEKYLKHDNLLNLEDLDLFSKLNILKEIIGLENNKSINIFNYIKRINSFPNKCITHRIILTIIISVVSKKNFAKLKLIKSNLKLIMSQ